MRPLGLRNLPFCTSRVRDRGESSTALRTTLLPHWWTARTESSGPPLRDIGPAGSKLMAITSISTFASSATSSKA